MMQLMFHLPRQRIMRRKSLKVGLLRQVREAAEDAMEFRQDPMGALIVRADTVWPPLAARALAALILGCLQSRPDRRPADMAAVLAALREVDKNRRNSSSTPPRTFFNGYHCYALGACSCECRGRRPPPPMQHLPRGNARNGGGALQRGPLFLRGLRAAHCSGSSRGLARDGCG